MRFLKILKVNDFTFSQTIDVDVIAVAVVRGLFVVNDLDGVAQIVIEIKIVVARNDGSRERKEKENVNFHFNFEFDARNRMT